MNIKRQYKTHSCDTIVVECPEETILAYDETFRFHQRVVTNIRFQGGYPL